MREYYRVCGNLPTEAYEVAVAEWYALGMAGCEETAVDASTTAVRIYFHERSAAQCAAAALEQCAAGGVTCEPVVNEDWNARWRGSMQPALLAPGWWVSPLWLEPPLSEGDRWIRIEPKMAFGTGHHETTRLATRAILGCGELLRGGRFLDIGTGSGVLCFVAAMLDAGNCVGVEIDPDCRGNLTENRRLNALLRCSFIIGPVDALSAAGMFDVIVMNMIHTESAPLLGRCRELLAPDGLLLWSGILGDEYGRAVDAAGRQSFLLAGEMRENEWWCGTFAKDNR